VIISFYLFKTSDIKIVEICREQLDFALPSVQLDRRCRNFDSRLVLTSIDLVKCFFLLFLLLTCYIFATRILVN